MNNPLDKLKQELSAMESLAKWGEHVSKKNAAFTGKINVPESERMADYLTDRFIAACNSDAVRGRFVGWKTKSTQEKKDITIAIVNHVLNSIKSDIWSGAVPIRTNSGEKYVKNSEQADKLFKESLTKDIKISVVEETQHQMGVDNSGELHINFDFILYGLPDCFLMDLRHEMMHVIDMFFPNISALPPSIIEEASRYYTFDSNNISLYKNNPLELNAEMKRAEYAKKIQNMVKAQEAALIKNAASRDM